MSTFDIKRFRELSKRDLRHEERTRKMANGAVLPDRPSPRRITGGQAAHITEVGKVIRHRWINKTLMWDETVYQMPSGSLLTLINTTHYYVR